MKRLLVLMLCMLILPAGCNTKMPETKSPRRRSASQPASGPASQPASSPASRPRPPAADRFRSVQKTYYLQLPVIRKHKWGQPITQGLVDAARRAFGVETWKDLEGVSHPMGGGIDWTDMNQSQVKGLIGVPSSKRTEGPDQVWVYDCGGAKLELVFQNNKVARYTAAGKP